jgi:hypothetical protein
LKSNKDIFTEVGYSILLYFIWASVFKLGTYLLGYSIGYWNLFGAVLVAVTVVSMVKVFIKGVSR